MLVVDVSEVRGKSETCILESNMEDSSDGMLVSSRGAEASRGEGIVVIGYLLLFFQLECLHFPLL